MSRRDAPSTSHSSSAIKGSNDKSKHGIHFSLDLKLKCKVKASNIHGMPLATDNKIAVRHRLYIPTLNSATVQHSVFPIYKKVPETSNCKLKVSVFIINSLRTILRPTR